MTNKTDSKPDKLSVITLLRVSAGFPSPADDYLETPLDLNELLISHPAATFFVRSQGESMMGAGIQDGDLLVVDRSLKAVNGDIVIAILNGDFTVKRLVWRGSSARLEPAHSSYKAISIDAETGVEIWGVVKYVIHKTR